MNKSNNPVYKLKKPCSKCGRKYAILIKDKKFLCSDCYKKIKYHSKINPVILSRQVKFFNDKKGSCFPFFEKASELSCYDILVWGDNKKLQRRKNLR